jgi:hypothetical protein
MKRLSLVLNILIALVVCATLAGSAQVQQAWVAKYNNNGISNGNHQGLKMTLDGAGNIYVLGVSANSNGGTGYVAVKYAANGTQVWAARYDSTNFHTAAATGFALDSGNAVVVTGNAVTVKYDANGNLVWTAPYNGTGISVDSGQNSYLTGVAGNFTTMKLSPAGSNIWSETWTYEGLQNLSQQIAVDSQTNVYAAGLETELNSRTAYQCVGVLKYDLNGNQLWTNNIDQDLPASGPSVVGLVVDNAKSVYVEFNYPVGGVFPGFETSQINSDGTTAWFDYGLTGSLGDQARAMTLDSQGKLLVTGGYAYAYPFEYTYVTYKLDTNGSSIWTNFNPSTPSGNSTATSVAVDQADSAYVTGYSTNGTTGNDIVTIKYDVHGNQSWLQRYDGPGHGNDAGNAIAVDNSGNVYVAGYETETNGFTSMILIKYSPVTVQKQSNGNFILQASGSPGESFDIQGSTNLQSWVDLGDVIADTNGLVQFADTNAASFPARFYYTIPQ